MRFALPMAIALCATTAQASTIHGLNVRLGTFITSDTTDFVGSLVNGGVNANPVFALDFDATATTLWGINNTTAEYGTFDLGTGAFNPTAVIVGPATGITGLTGATDGSWYLMEFNSAAASSFLWVGDVTNGTFTQVGMTSAGIMIDISINCVGELYGHNISDDSLYSIDTTTGAGTLIGPTGLAANFAQGMDFDWSDGKLYATVYTGGGTGQFCEMNLVTGAATPLQDTTPTNGEFEIAIQVASDACNGSTGTPVCFGDGSGAPCGCGNESDAMSGGCRNSVSGTQGAILTITSVRETIPLIWTGWFTCQNVRTQPGLFFRGDNTIGGGTGATFGDGVRCCGQNVVRIILIDPPPAPEPVTIDIPMMDLGPGIMPGDKFCYQYWYRDPGGPCGSNFNFSNAVSIIF